MDELDKLTERWIKDYRRHPKISKIERKTRHS
jgi:hypothetical protein